MIPAGRPALSLDGEWEFVPDPQGKLHPMALPRGTTIAVPGAWEAQLPYPSGIVRAWYRRRFTVPDGWDGGRLVLRFGAVLARAEVWLDGRPIGTDQDGHLPFELVAGPAHGGVEHEIVVRVENPLNAIVDYPAFGDAALQAVAARLGGTEFETLPSGKQHWYTGTSGLTGSVLVERVGDARFAALSVHANPDATAAVMRWRLADDRAASDRRVEATVTSPTGEVIARRSAEARLGSLSIPMRHAERWDLGQPMLHRLVARLCREKAGAGDLTTDDVLARRFGMRSITVRRGEILLNGRPIYLRGALDQDFWPRGRSNPPSKAALEAQVARAQEMGLNLLRCHLKIPDPAYLDVADEAGMLVWCELPSWIRRGPATRAAARRLLERMVDTMGHHPSIVAWTIVNEDWGTGLRHSSDDRQWLGDTAKWLKALDPSRLVIDNSACETPVGPNFHLRTDLADFHAYRSMPDGVARWRTFVEDFSRRPSWLWSAHGDAQRSGDEALVISEFGGWGLPRLEEGDEGRERSGWWSTTGRTFHRPEGIARRFRQQGLERIWPDVDRLADATQAQQFAGLAAQIREIRRHPSIKGYVATELSDTGWEANGLLDRWRHAKAFFARLPEALGPEVLIVRLPRCDFWGGECLSCEVLLASFPDGPRADPDGPVRLAWQIRVSDTEGVRPGRRAVETSGSGALARWPSTDWPGGADLALSVPEVTGVAAGEMMVKAVDGAGVERAIFRQPVVIVPSALRRSPSPRRVTVIDAAEAWSVGSRLASLGHEIVSAEEAALTVTSTLDPDLAARAQQGDAVVLLARSPDAIQAPSALARDIAIRPRRLAEDLPEDERPWDGDRTSVFAWALPGVVPGLVEGGLLGDPHREIYPDHVVDGLDPGAMADGVQVGLFSGWIHAPATLLAHVELGAGRLIATTLRLSPEDGPVATAMLESIVQRALAKHEGVA